MNSPLVTVSIPTYNSAVSLKRCLDALYSQTYKNIEVNLVDGFSSDATLAVAERYPITFFQDKMGLLNARKIGAEKALGELVLLLDSDQILEQDAVERAVRILEKDKLDMLVLEERVYKSETPLEKLFQLDRKLIHAVRDFSPITGVMLPRFYRKDVLQRAINNIPQQVLKAGGQDHAIIYYEAWQLSQKVDLLNNAVSHVEPSTLRELVPKFYRWGRTSRQARVDKYKGMLAKKERFRKGMFSRGLIGASLASILLLLIKGFPYKLGEFVSRKEKNGL